MAGLVLVVRAGLRRRLGALAGLAVITALGIGVAIASLEAAVRTERAYPSYLARAEVGELVVNPSFLTDRAEEVIAATPGVDSYTSDSLLTATVEADDGRSPAEVESTQVRVSADGRYLAQDRPVVHRGRMIGRGDEAFVNTDLAEALGIDVGDTLALAFWSNSYAEGGDPAAPVEPIGRATPVVVGIGAFADETLTDDLYPRHRVLLAPEVGSRFDCTPPHPGPADTRSLDELAVSLLPPDCAASYRYFSLRVRGGDGGVAALSAELSARFGRENQRLPAAIRAGNVGFDVVPTVTADERLRVQRSLAPAVRALQLFAAAAAVSTVVLVLLAAARTARRRRPEAGTWRDLGATRAMVWAGLGVPVAAAVAAGLLGAVVAGWALSGLGPVAGARTVAPAGRLGLAGDVLLMILGGSALVLILGVAAATRPQWRTDAADTPQRTSRAVRALSRSTSPAARLGVVAATADAGSRAVLAAAVVSVSAVLATVVFSTSLDRLVSEPGRFGWPYDVAALLNAGYGGTTDRAAIAATLDRPEVRRWSLASVSNPLSIGGRVVPSVAGRDGFDAMRLPLVAGRLPVAEDEIALGATTARSLDLGPGDGTEVTTDYGSRAVTVTGLVVLPPVGPFLGDRASLGTGALLPPRLLDALIRQAVEAGGLDPGFTPDEFSGFVAVDLVDGADPARFVDSIASQLRTWDASGGDPYVYSGPVRPPAVANVAAMRSVPIALAGCLAVAMSVGLALVIAMGTRTRRRELAVIRALGGVGRQLRATVRWQALTVVAVGLAVGIPLGLAGGRQVYRSFARGLGLPPDALMPVGPVLALVVVTIGVALLAAAGPGRRAARVAAAGALRGE